MPERCTCRNCNALVYRRDGDLGQRCLYCGGELVTAVVVRPRPVAETCKRCGDVIAIRVVQRFRTGDTHVRAECPKCNGFIRYVPKGANGGAAGAKPLASSPGVSFESDEWGGGE